MVGTNGPADTLNRSGSLRRQRGFGVFLLLVVIGGLTATAAMYSFYRIDSVAVENVRHTADLMASTKAALIGYAVRRGRTTCSVPNIPINALVCNPELAERPGELPCPDSNPPGTANAGVAAATCIAGAIGRVPWKTLGIPEPRDSAGETLWYALSGNFRTRAAWSPLAPIDINSDTRGTITVRAADNSVLTTEAVAVIVAPGASQGAQQNRSTTDTLLCTALNSTPARNLCPANYLETVTFNSITRSVTAVTIPDPATAGVNDRVIYFSTSEVIAPVEMRVAGEVKKLLEGYRANSGCQCYPWADTWEYSGGIADLGQNRGRFPTVPYPHAWGVGAIPVLPPWLEANDWHNLIWYSVAKTNTAGGGQLCRTCSTLNQLAITGQPAVSVVFFTPGTPLDGLPRVFEGNSPPPGGSTTRRDTLSVYLQDAENNNGASASCPESNEIGNTPASTMLPGATSCDTYVVPSATARDRDRMHTLTSTPPSMCSRASQVLTNMGPCRISGNTVSAMCTAAVNELSANGCACTAAGQAMLQAPCRIDPGLNQCQAHINVLNSCG